MTESGAWTPRPGDEGPPPPPPKPDYHDGFVKGLLLGLALAFLVIAAMAAGRLAHNPDKVLAAVLATGVPVDPRVSRVPQAVRRTILCAALNIVMESRGEPDSGQVAVAWVVRTRAKERDLDACAVTFEPNQFEWTSYPQRRIVAAATNNGETFLEAQDHAWKVFMEDAADPGRGANHFYGHKAIKPPRWTRQAVPGSRVVIANHTFLRLPASRAGWVNRAFNGGGMILQ